MHRNCVHEAGDGDAEPRCPHFGMCGGCGLQHLTQQSQLALKQRHLLGVLARHGAAPARVLDPLFGPAWGYRYRARMAVREVPKKGGVLVGFRERRHGYITDMDGCAIMPECVSSLIGPLKKLIGGLSISNRVPQIEFAVDDGGPSLVIRHLAPLSDADLSMLANFGDEHAARIFLQPGGMDTVAPLTPADDGKLSYALPEWNVVIAHGPVDFVQINPYVNRMLVHTVVALLDPQPHDRIADLFCGIGNFTLPLARSGARVTGYELVGGHIQRARFNADANGLGRNTAFETADLLCAAPCIPPLDGYPKILIDPPRSGAEAVVRSLAAGAMRILYVSCNPATLARDAGVLVRDRGFSLIACGVVDMFPQTLHAEAVALFER